MSVYIAPQKMNLRKWYSSSVRIPGYQHRHYYPFVANCVGIVSGLVERSLGKRIKVRLMRGGTAVADQDNCVIKINQDFLQGKFDEEQTMPLDSDETIAALLGIIVHEAAHFAFSPKTLLTWTEYIKSRTQYKYNESVAAVLGNITEDIFIEAEVGRRLPNLFWMLEASTRTLFTDADIRERVAKVKHVQDAPLTLQEVPPILNYLVLAKVPGVRPDVSSYLTDLFELAQEAAEVDKPDDRLELTLGLYDMLMDSVGKKKEQENEKPVASPNVPVQSSGVGKSEGDEGEGRLGTSGSEDSEGERSQGVGISEDGEEQDDEEQDGFGTGMGLDADDEEGEFGASFSDGAFGDDDEGESFEEALKQALKDAQGLNSSHEDKIREFKLSAPLTSHEARIAQGQLDDMGLYNMLPYEGEGADEESSLVVEQYCEMGEAMEMDKRYMKLAEAGRQRATVNRPYGEDKVRGTSLRRLHRIATDGKIFAERVPMGDYRPMQVAILIDASGSMGSNFSLGRDRRIDKAVRAALGACYGLMEARCEVAIYAHTADTLYGNETLVFVVKEFHQGLEGLDERLHWLSKKSPKSSNRDGVAITHVAKKFTRPDRRRVLIVISDGMPSASGYGGEMGIKRTAKDVASVREQGIDVLSISIAVTAKTPNDKIYGSEANVFNEDPNVIEQIVERLIQQPGRR